MKISKFLVPTIGFSFLFGSSVQGASSVTFETDADGALFADNVAGWSQSNTNPTAFDTTSPLAYIATTNFGGGGTNSGHLGTQFGNTPDNSSTTVSTNAGLLDFLGLGPAPMLTMNLAILDETGDSDNFPGRDTFSVELRNSSAASLAEIKFVPTVGAASSWDIQVGVGGTETVSTNQTISALEGQRFQINFGNATTFSYGDSIGGVSDIPLLTLDGLGFGGVDFASIDSIAMTHIPLADVGTSANTLAFDDIALSSVPEPSGVALLLLGSTFLMGRRRA
jgi:hypothetical protein